jgi:hypothetical protein
VKKQNEKEGAMEEHYEAEEKGNTTKMKLCMTYPYFFCRQTSRPKCLLISDLFGLQTIKILRDLGSSPLWL